MRHPAAPTIITVLIGLLFAIIIWSKWRSDEPHEGDPHPDDVPTKTDEEDDISDGIESNVNEEEIS